MKKYICLIFLMTECLILTAQETHPYNGVRPKEVTSLALVHCTLYVDYATRLDDATLIVEKGRVTAAGKDLVIPSNAVVRDMHGMWIYPSFIDIYSDYGMPKVEAREWNPHPQLESDRKGAFGWNQAIRADRKSALLFQPAEEQAKELRGLGFGVVLTHQMDGIARGTGTLAALGNNAAISVLKQEAAAFYSFSKGSSSQQYPSSLMGSIALLRQTYYDAKWYTAGGNLDERNLALDNWSGTQYLPQIFDAGGKWNAIRADRIGDEFGVNYIIKGGGDEYQRLREIKATGATFILPINFPEAWNVSDPYLARLVSLTDMKHWELAPSNPGVLQKAGVTVCLTINGLSDRNRFLPALRKIRDYGMSESEILKSLTSVPARLVKSEKELGALGKGMWANFFVSSSNIFDKDAVIYENYVMGEPFTVNALPPDNLSGTYQLKLAGSEFIFKMEGEPGKYKSSIKNVNAVLSENLVTGQVLLQKDTLSRKAAVEQNGQLISVIIDADSSGKFPQLTLSGQTEGDRWLGRYRRPDGEWSTWSAQRISTGLIPKKTEKLAGPLILGEVTYPFTAYGWKESPKSQSVHFIHASVWTCEKEGIIEDGEVIIHNGKIAAVGHNLSDAPYPGIIVVDARGKSLTPGIIDEHSHIALESVNEGTQASSAEVKESSVILPDDVNIYRQLSGGVTAAQLLHGSANPIGGQSALVKMRWGLSDEEMLIEGADGFIKFALGENVKQSNWGDFSNVRFPQTRMGVEQVYYDHFIRAREYGEQRKKYTGIALGKKRTLSSPAPRRDLELDALLEILESRRFVTCHSYQQGEINMLMHVADSMGFRINTFTHILEGYKVADKMKAHGAGASSFSDWWAYKAEVKDAIPYNGALMWENGLTVAFNSDDAEMARRLNQEAAKAVKYGGVPEEEALRFVTLNPAKLLHLDHRMGSIRVGKDADLVLWSDHPLSVYAKAEKTFVDGVCYYDASLNGIRMQEIERERARLIGKMIAEKDGGSPTRDPEKKMIRDFHCDTLGDR
jgi:imidazolonepropionase-like amidohydrolase